MTTVNAPSGPRNRGARRRKSPLRAAKQQGRADRRRAAQHDFGLRIAEADIEFDQLGARLRRSSGREQDAAKRRAARAMPATVGSMISRITRSLIAAS
jgi:hypothetical protein